MVSRCRRFAAFRVAPNGVCGLTPAAMCYRRSAAKAADVGFLAAKPRQHVAAGVSPMPSTLVFFHEITRFGI
jgi:hypothetical protein